MRTTGMLDREVLLREAIRANVRASVEHLQHGSELLENLIRNDGLVVVGAEYSLETGAVAFFDELRPIPSLPEKGAT